MSNALAQNPMFVDTAATLWTDRRVIKAVAWLSDAVNPIVADDGVLLSSSGGVIIISKIASFDGDGIEMYHFPAGFDSTGLIVTTIDNGHLHIFY